MNNPLLVKQKNYIRKLMLQMDEAEIDQLAEVLPLHAVQVVSPPKTGSMMATVRDCFETDFYLGEILVSRAEVDYGGHRAQATVLGDNLKAALVAAVLEAVCLAGETQIFEEVTSAYKSAERKIAAANELETKLIAATHVNFQSMAKES